MPTSSNIFTKNQQAIIDTHLLRANNSRLKHEYKTGQQFFGNLPNCDNNLDLVCRSPFPILQIHTNNTVTIQCGPIHERINICRITPFKPTP